MRVVVFDRTCVRTRGGLTPAWAVGSRLYAGLGRIDASHGATSWADALAWVATRDAPIRELQYWGHGTWGAARVGTEVFDAGALAAAHPLRRGLDAVRERLAPDALVWFRTCKTLGARAGVDFAARLSDYLGARVAGHTHIIGFHQSGLHGLGPGRRPDWSPAEGVAAGGPDQPRRAAWSRPWAPRTITCLTGAVPRAWFADGVAGADDPMPAPDRHRRRV